MLAAKQLTCWFIQVVKTVQCTFTKTVSTQLQQRDELRHIYLVEAISAAESNESVTLDVAIRPAAIFISQSNYMATNIYRGRHRCNIVRTQKHHNSP